MGRKWDDSKRETVRARDLHTGDQIVCRDGETIMYVRKATKAGAIVEVEFWGGRLYRLVPERKLTVMTEHDCKCSGSGMFRGGGAVVNGVYQGFEGECFGCHGKGWQDRQDVIRNATYWNKYARV